jgi:hypothetical protein
MVVLPARRDPADTVTLDSPPSGGYADHRAGDHPVYTRIRLLGSGHDHFHAYWQGPAHRPRCGP